MIPARGPQTVFFCSSLLCNLGYATLLFASLGGEARCPKAIFWAWLGKSRQVAAGLGKSRYLGLGT